MLFSEWYNNQCIHKNWQSYNQIDRGTICAKELPFRVQPFRGVNCGLIPEEMVPNRNESEPRPRNRRLTPLNSLIEFASKDMNFYSEASNIVKLVKIKQGSVKNLVFSSDQQNKKALYALVCESLKYYDVLSEVLERSHLLKHEKSLKNNAQLGVVLLYEHLLGKGLTGKCQEIIKRHKSSIHSQCELMKVRARVTNLKELVANSEPDTELTLPKYVRVNTIKTDRDTVVQEFTEKSWSHVPCSKESFKEVVSTLDKSSFTTDPHIPDILVFPSSTDLHDNRMYVAGEIILQDKASCFPAYLLSPPPGSLVIDCCAAPGNKTSHLAAIMGNKGTVFAFDRDPKRLTTLENMMKKAGATCVTAQCQDFLRVSPADSKYRNVEYILVDPSCSGTGMVNRKKDQINEDGISEERLEQLSKFQITILKHAFKFPKVKRIVYSTCSIHEKENEQVVEEVMSSVNQNFKMRLLLPDWSERGVSSYEHAHCCLRMSHGSALTNGFFVACFERKGDIESNTSGTETHFAQSKIIDYNLEEIKHKHKKRKKLKNSYEDDSAIQESQTYVNIDVTSIHSDSRKRKHSPTDNDVIENTGETLGDEEEHRHRNTCKKKRKKSKQRDIFVDSNKIDNLNKNDIEHRHTSSCKKKKKKSKQQESDIDTKVEIDPKHTNSCKKKRKKSKQRDIMEDKVHASNNYENRHSNNCRKKRKKSKQRDISENHHDYRKKLKNETENRHTSSCKKKRKKSKQKTLIC